MNQTIHFTSGEANPLGPDTGDRRWVPVEVVTKRVGQRAERRELVPNCQVQPDGKVVSGLSTAVRPTPLHTPVFRRAGTTQHSIEGDLSGIERRMLGMMPELGAPYGVVQELISEGYLANYDIYRGDPWWRVWAGGRTCLVCGAAESSNCGC